jgi:hypothetical protein
MNATRRIPALKMRGFPVASFGKRNRHNFVGFDGYQVNADINAAMNIAKWEGFACPLGLYVPEDGVFDSPQDFGSPSASGRAEMQMGNSVNTQRPSAAAG